MTEPETEAPQHQARLYMYAIFLGMVVFGSLVSVALGALMSDRSALWDFRNWLFAIGLVGVVHFVLVGLFVLLRENLIEDLVKMFMMSTLAIVLLGAVQRLIVREKIAPLLIIVPLALAFAPACGVVVNHAIRRLWDR